jgi:hypothetical protein
MVFGSGRFWPRRFAFKRRDGRRKSVTGWLGGDGEGHTWASIMYEAVNVHASVVLLSGGVGGGLQAHSVAKQTMCQRLLHHLHVTLTGSQLHTQEPANAIMECEQATCVKTHSSRKANHGKPL